jgi:hypothetical protein
VDEKATTPEFAQCQSLRRSKSASCGFAGDRSIRLQVSAFAGVERLNEIAQPLKTIRSFCVANSSNFARRAGAFENKTADMCRANRLGRPGRLRLLIEAVCKVARVPLPFVIVGGNIRDFTRTTTIHSRRAENHNGADRHRVFERQRCGCGYLAALGQPVLAFSQKLCCFDML